MKKDSIAIRVENLGKLYRLGEIGTGTISHDLNRWFARLRGKDDPYARIGEQNDRTTSGLSEYVWALRNISFQVKQGSILGIIGRNGAGKSTLLKLLSKVTSPTEGTIKVKGRIASLLEVGTGFHPELTGRENVFLNGAILGMTKAEIRRKFDEIVSFAGVERYIDTPVKRYSSGMYVRLAFAVAAFLEPEVLIVDEVLAVGDAEFQKKCLGRMQDVSKNEGRTVLFVSHNMGAIRNLCQEVLILKNGLVHFQGDVHRGIEHYINLNAVQSSTLYINPLAADCSQFTRLEVVAPDEESREEFDFREAVSVRCEAHILPRHLSAKFSLRVTDNLERIVFTSEMPVQNLVGEAGDVSFRVTIPGSLLVPNSYRIQMAIHIPNQELVEELKEVLKFSILDTGTEFYMYGNADYGCVFVDCKWDLEDLRPAAKRSSLIINTVD